MFSILVICAGHPLIQILPFTMTLDFVATATIAEVIAYTLGKSHLKLDKNSEKQV